MPSAQLRDYGARYSFKAPLPLPEIFGAKEEGEGDEEQETDAGPNGFDNGEEPVEVRINAGILGTIFHPKQKYLVEYADDSTGEVEVGDQHHKCLATTSLYTSSGFNAACAAGQKFNTRSQCDTQLSGHGRHQGSLEHAAFLLGERLDRHRGRPLTPCPGVENDGCSPIPACSRYQTVPSYRYEHRPALSVGDAPYI